MVGINEVPDLVKKMNFEGLSLNCDAQEMHPALEIEDILEYVFAFLNVEETKNCRLVNRNWKFVATKLLRQKCQVTFDFNRNAAAFLEAILKTENVGTIYYRYKCKSSSPFATFFLSGLLFSPTVNHFVEMFHESIRELILEGELKLFGDCSSERMFDLDSMISPNLTKLHVYQGNSDVEVQLSSDKIAFIKDLYLENCTLRLKENKHRITPTKINLTNNKYIRNGESVSKVAVDDFFDLRYAQSIMLDGENLSLDFARCTNERISREVSLIKVALTNWSKCNWTASLLFLNEISFVEKNLMRIKELVCTNATIDTSVIQNRPICQHAECISVFHEPFNPFNSPDVTQAQLHEECIVMLPFCFHMDNLREIEISNTDMTFEDRERVQLQVEHLPVNVKLKVNNYILCLKIT